MGLKVLKCDGNDVVKIYKILKKAVNETRRGSGPYFLEFSTYRWLEHCGPNFDNNIGYRSEKEFQKWKKREPIKRVKKLINSKFSKQINKIHKDINREVTKSFDFAEKSPFPKQSEAFKGVYA